jgi:2-methylcitrate dehydratase PrpD
MTDTPLTDALAQFALAADPAPEAQKIMQLSLLDWIAVARAGREEPVAQAVRALAREEGGAQVANLLGDALKVPPRMAALVNGTIGHALDYDDTHFAHIGHPSTVIVPAVLAVGQAMEASGQAVQQAALIGVEASVRVGLWLGRGHYQVGYHQTATAGAFGAALACARLLGLSLDQTRAVLGLCATRASGLKSQFGTMAKPFNAGLAASNGVEAALLVKHGMAPNVAGLECVQGFGDTHHGVGDLSALKGLGQAWRFIDVSHKFHACCHGLHATLEAFQPFRSRASEIAEIAVRTHSRWLRVCNIANPVDGLECKFSYAQVLAMAAHGHDTAVIGSYTAQAAQDAELAGFRQKVQVTGDDALTETEAHLTLRLTDGSETVLTHDLLSPMSYEARRDKVRAKARALLGAPQEAEVWGRITSHAPAGDLAALLP